MRRLTPLMLVPALWGCKKVEAAPKELDDLVHWFWGEFDGGDEALISEGVGNLYDVVDPDALEDDQDEQDGTITVLSDAEIELVMSGDSSGLFGLYMINVVDCSFEDMGRALTNSKQADIYGVYDTYSRSYTSDVDDFLSGAADTVTWEASYSTSVLTSTFEADMLEGMRRIPGTGDADEAWLFRRYMPTPGQFEEGSSSTFSQDYKIEVYGKLSGNRSYHLHGMWREVDIGIDSESEGAQRLVLNGMADWDKDTEDFCQGRR